MRRAKPRRYRRPRRPKLPTMGALKRKLDVLFSRYVLERDRRPDGAWSCVTCGRTSEAINAGHFISRRYMSTRWDPKNCHAQCVPCNWHKRGAPDEYALYVCDTYGPGELRRLLDRKRIQVRWTRPAIESLISAIQRDGMEFECLYYEVAL